MSIFTTVASWWWTVDHFGATEVYVVLAPGDDNPFRLEHLSRDLR